MILTSLSCFQVTNTDSERDAAAWIRLEKFQRAEIGLWQATGKQAPRGEMF